MLLLLDTDGGEKNFNSPLIYSLHIKISVNVNYPNHFHGWHTKTEKSERLYFLLVEEKVNRKYFHYLLITYFSHPQCSHFPWSLDPAWANNSHQTEQENTAAHSPSTAGPDKLRGKGGNVQCVPPMPRSSSGAVGSPLLLSALCRARKDPGGAGP